MNIDQQIKDVFDFIIDEVVTGLHSPYYDMINKAKDIDIDYFENIDRGVNKMSDELNLELKDKIVDSFSKMADGYFFESDMESRLVSLIKNKVEVIKEVEGINACNDFLNKLAERLEMYAKGTNLHAGFSKYTIEDVYALYQDAKKITIKEFMLGDNGEDILDFYSALMDYTWWACRVEIVRKTNDFILSLASKARKIACV